MLHGRHDRKIRGGPEPRLSSLCEWRAFGKITGRTDHALSRRRRPCQRMSSAGCRSPHTTVQAPCWRPGSRSRAHPCSPWRCIDRSNPLLKNSSDHSHQVPSFLTPRKQVVAIDQRRRHVRRHRSEHQAGSYHAIEFTDRPRHLLFRDMTQAGLEHKIEFTVLERHIDDRSQLVVFLQRLRRPRMDRAVVLDAPCIDAAIAQRADQFATGGTGHQQLVALARFQTILMRSVR